MNDNGKLVKKTKLSSKKKKIEEIITTPKYQKIKEML